MLDNILDGLQSGQMMIDDRRQHEMGCYVVCSMVHKIEQVEDPFSV